MSNAMCKRLARLEGVGGDEDIVITIRQFGPGEYDRVKGPGGQMIERLPDEGEEAFLERARADAMAIAKKELGRQPCYVIQPLRSGDTAQGAAIGSPTGLSSLDFMNTTTP